MGVVCGSIYSNIKHRQYYEDALPPLIMLDKKLYQLYDINQEKPEDSADGYITKIVSNQIIPSEDKTANFGNIGMQYWQQPNGVYILVNNIFSIFLFVIFMLVNANAQVAWFKNTKNINTY